MLLVTAADDKLIFSRSFLRKFDFGRPANALPPLEGSGTLNTSSSLRNRLNEKSPKMHPQLEFSPTHGKSASEINFWRFLGNFENFKFRGLSTTF